MLAVLERLPRQLAQLEQLIGRACDQVETLMKYAQVLEQSARRTMATQTGDRAAVHAELERLRSPATAALR